MGSEMCIRDSPRLVQMFRWQGATRALHTYTDSDWAGDKTTRKSTSGGIAFLGSHCIKSWSTNQTIIALSSAEAELYALLKGASQTLGLQSMAADFGDIIQAGLWSDASAAIAISQRSGLGKLRHIQTQYLWLQERVSCKDVALTKALGTNNPADLLTKHLGRPDVDRHLRFSGLIIRTGRADGSLQVAGVTCSSLSSKTSAALRIAMGRRVIYGTPEIVDTIAAVGGSPRGFYDNGIADCSRHFCWRRLLSAHTGDLVWKQ